MKLHVYVVSVGIKNEGGSVVGVRLCEGEAINLALSQEHRDGPWVEDEHNEWVSGIDWVIVRKFPVT